MEHAPQKKSCLDFFHASDEKVEQGDQTFLWQNRQKYT
jgi:hypothetical protein